MPVRSLIGKGRAIAPDRHLEHADRRARGFRYFGALPITRASTVSAPPLRATDPKGHGSMETPTRKLGDLTIGEVVVDADRELSGQQATDRTRGRRPDPLRLHRQHFGARQDRLRQARREALARDRRTRRGRSRLGQARRRRCQARERGRVTKTPGRAGSVADLTLPSPSTRTPCVRAGRPPPRGRRPLASEAEGVVPASRCGRPLPGERRSVPAGRPDRRAAPCGHRSLRPAGGCRPSGGVDGRPIVSDGRGGPQAPSPVIDSLRERRHLPPAWRGRTRTDDGGSLRQRGRAAGAAREVPGLLAGDQFAGADARRWLLIGREVGRARCRGGTGRWSVDHVFLDQDAVPTIVEVKRSSDTRLRREVVGQVIDYAANAVVYWPVDKLRNVRAAV